MKRSVEREQAFILIFEKAFNPEASVEDLFQAAVESEFLELSDYTRKLAEETITNLEAIDAKIAEYSDGWNINRITKVSLSVLRIAVCEILFEEDVPKGVSINEAVELAKKYAGKEDSAFINGVLGSIVRAD